MGTNPFRASARKSAKDSERFGASVPVDGYLRTPANSWRVAETKYTVSFDAACAQN